MRPLTVLVPMWPDSDTLLARVSGVIARTAADMRRRRQMRRNMRELAALDVPALRDLALTPSEIGSVASELAGKAPATRRHAGLLPNIES